jgi:hypothetical protein
MHGASGQKPASAGTPYLDVSRNRPNEFGLRGLGPGGGEWVVVPGGRVRYGVMVAVLAGPPRFEVKHPWQAFAWVGFRGARSIRPVKR